MKRKVYKNGCSLVVGLTETAKEMLELKAGDKVDMTVKDGQIIIKKVEGDK